MYRITTVGPVDHEPEMRDLLLKAIAERPLLLHELRTEDIGDNDEVLLQAKVQSEKQDDQLVEQITYQLRDNEFVSNVEWAEAPLESE